LEKRLCCRAVRPTATIISSDTPLLLGSASPRRREILAGLGLPIHVLPSDVAEEQARDESPAAYLERIVLDKLSGVARLCADLRYAAILVADTIVVVDGDVLGKPVDVTQAAELVGRLVGRTHTVYTGYALSLPAAPARPATYRVVATEVGMRAASNDEVVRYARTGEGLDKAGAYAAQGIGAFLIERIAGSYTNVIGLPACELVRDLCALGLLGGFPT
jgi:septum formation protein